MTTFYTSEREMWREWLTEHFQTENEIWFVFPMKESGDKALLYNDAVEEALCFGWIDITFTSLSYKAIKTFFELIGAVSCRIYIGNTDAFVRFG